MDPSTFLSDLEAKPAALRGIAEAIDDGSLRWPIERAPQRVLLTGMGSSWFAAQSAALRLRRAGISAVAELSSTEASWPAADDLLTVAISASGGSTETLQFVEAYSGYVALTNTPDSRITAAASAVIPMLAGPEVSGVACRSFQHTLLALLVLEEQLVGEPLSLGARARAAADATEWLLDRRGDWRPGLAERLDGPHGVWFMAPAERISSSLQSALMVREGPRRPADGCETGDWSHVDVYLTKTLDYRAVVYAGGRHDAAAAEWMRQRGTTAVAVGADFDVAQQTIRFPGDDDPIVALLTETLIAELLAYTWWSQRGAG
ncbi:MAG: iron dicitrate transport regulator FecR [Actinobacteria bacterium]|nr:iron dicitrate transport regulator FecR [Actinomycetota bacterium]